MNCKFKNLRKYNNLFIFCSDDELRPSMTGIYWDIVDKVFCATNGNRLITNMEYGYKIVSDHIVLGKNGYRIDELFPDFPTVIDKEESLPYKFSFQCSEDLLNFLDDISKKNKDKGIKVIFSENTLKEISYGELTFIPSKIRQQELIPPVEHEKFLWPQYLLDWLLFVVARRGVLPIMVDGLMDPERPHSALMFKLFEEPHTIKYILMPRRS
jgi:hypothetical protein